MIRVSTIIPTYNSEATLAQAIDSALAQDFAGQEIIVVNDGSTDSTQRVFESYGTRVSVIQQDNRGQPTHAPDNEALAARAGAALQYSVSEGFAPLRQWLCDYMRAKGVACGIDNILITTGSQQGIYLTGRLILDPGDGTDVRTGDAPTVAKRWGQKRVDDVLSRTRLP